MILQNQRHVAFAEREIKGDLPGGRKRMNHAGHRADFIDGIKGDHPLRNRRQRNRQAIALFEPLCGKSRRALINITGKLLSPRKIMMATRDRLEAVGKNINTNKSFVDDGKSLLHDYISVEELRACTTCNACVEACPVSIAPMEIIVELRRSLIMEESNAPQEWNGTFSNIENNFAPWKFSPDDRDQWTAEA